MQNHAFYQTNSYLTVFEPLPADQENPLYFDLSAVTLPYAEDFPKLHYHNRYEIGFCEEGEGLFLADGQYYSISQGEWIFVPPECPHYSRSLSNAALCKCRFVYLHGDSVKHLLESRDQTERQAVLQSAGRIPVVIRENQHPNVAKWLKQIVDYCIAGAPSGELLPTLYLAGLLAEAEATLPSPLRPHYTRNDMEPSVAEMTASYLSLHYADPITVKDLSDTFHLSESQLRRQFVKAYGIPPMAYRNRLRCKIAGELLSNPNLSISDIAKRLGYTTPSDFCRAFRTHYGISPGDHRKHLF